MIDDIHPLIWAACILAATLLIMQQCHYKHEEAMACGSHGGYWLNDRCMKEPPK